MDRITEIITIATIDDVPSIKSIRAIPRKKRLQLVFNGAMVGEREAIASTLENELAGFEVYVHSVNPEINIYKTITDEEIDQHQAFLESCAIDYHNLATKLIVELCQKFNVDLTKELPTSIARGDRKFAKGIVNEWRYRFHGGHCGFEHLQTGQSIEVCLTTGLEFGCLGSFWFMRFINTTKSYHPLPVEIFDESDVFNIIQRLITLGILEYAGDSGQPVAAKGRINTASKAAATAHEKKKNFFRSFFKR